MIIYRFQVIRTSRDPSLSIFMLLEPYEVSSPPYIESKWNLLIPVGIETYYPLMKTNQHFFSFKTNGRKCDFGSPIHGIINSGQIEGAYFGRVLSIF